MSDVDNLPVIEPSLDELQNELGASLTNLLERCITFPSVPANDSYSLQIEYIRNNAQHVKNLMTKAQKMMEDQGVALIKDEFRE